AGDAWIALHHDSAFATEFGMDAHRTGVALLKRMVTATTDETRIAGIGMAAYYAAQDHTLDEDQSVMLTFYDVAIRSALRSNHAALYSHVRDNLELLRAPRTLGKLLAGSLRNSPWPAATVVSGLLQGEIRMLEPLTLRDLKALFEDFGSLGDDRAARTLSADELIALSAHATHPLMQTGMLRCAQQRLVRDYLGKNEVARREACAKIVKLAERLCQADGLSRLRFDHDAKLSQLAFAN